MIADEMLVPLITSGMKERHRVAADRIASCGFVVFEIIATLTRQREIARGRFASSVEWSNMLDGKALCRVRFLTQAIFATSLRTITYEYA